MTALASLTVSAYVATASMTMTASVTFTDARCPNCKRLVMSVPGAGVLDVRAVPNNAARSGRGPVVGCARCKTLVEVIAHR